MEIKLQNKYIVPGANFLQTIKLKGADSRARSKLVKLLAVAAKELEDAEMELLEEFGVKGEDGKLLPDSTGTGYNLIAETSADYHKQHNILLDEWAEISGGTYVNHIDKVLEILNNYDGELDGKDAEVYDELLNAMEESKEEGK